MSSSTPHEEHNRSTNRPPQAAAAAGLQSLMAMALGSFRHRDDDHNNTKSGNSNPFLRDVQVVRTKGAPPSPSDRDRGGSSSRLQL